MVDKLTTSYFFNNFYGNFFDERKTKMMILQIPIISIDYKNETHNKKQSKLTIFEMFQYFFVTI